MLRQLDHAQAGHPRHLGHVGGERDVVALLQRVQHLVEGGGAALALEFAVMRAGAADGLDAEPVGGARIDLAVAVARDQRLDAVLGVVALDERRQEMLAVPHGDDHRHFRDVVDVGRLEGDAAVRVPDQTEIPGPDRADGFLEGGRARDPIKQPHWYA